MYKKQITLKPDTPDATYTAMCNMMEKQGVFVACGSQNDKWIIGNWDNEEDYFAWIVALAKK